MSEYGLRCGCEVCRRLFRGLLRPTQQAMIPHFAAMKFHDVVQVHHLTIVTPLFNIQIIDYSRIYSLALPKPFSKDPKAKSNQSQRIKKKPSQHISKKHPSIRRSFWRRGHIPLLVFNGIAKIRRSSRGKI
ncbi:unnamed protein product [Periconia digitata]|uniref:Uncharacterized protein n=1 Tax=Periconia digitata TaxID=1303443 RepID=A0A9W4ULM9_9PLEO|nr:unnamed protein product [Periconia digitata]